MRLATYEKIKTRLQASGDLELVQAEFKDDKNISPQCIEGIYYRIIQIDNRRKIWKFETRKLTPIALWECFQSNLLQDNKVAKDSLILKMANEFDKVSACYLARLIVKGYIEHLKDDPLGKMDKHDENEDDNEKAIESVKETTIATNDPINIIDKNDVTSAQINKHQSALLLSLSFSKIYREPTLIPHKILGKNVSKCHLMDPHFAPAMDEYRGCIGKKYEDILSDYLKRMDIPFLDETAMRMQKYARTPDTILLEPICIDGLVVKWIESKAWFGDPLTHATYLRDQYWPYYNRFGPGLVIYWFGFVEEAVESHHNQGVAILDHFPSDSGRIVRIKSEYEQIVTSLKPTTTTSPI